MAQPYTDTIQYTYSYAFNNNRYSQCITTGELHTKQTAVNTEAVHVVLPSKAKKKQIDFWLHSKFSNREVKIHTPRPYKALFLVCPTLKSLSPH